MCQTARTRIEYSEGHDGAHLSDRVLMLVTVRSFQMLPKIDNLSLGLLDEHQRHGDTGALAHKVHRVLEQGLEQSTRRFEPCMLGLALTDRTLLQPRCCQ
jgi:hypothetical protein